LVAARCTFPLVVRPDRAAADVYDPSSTYTPNASATAFESTAVSASAATVPLDTTRTTNAIRTRQVR
jgi:hypothetical protein